MSDDSTQVIITMLESLQGQVTSIRDEVRAVHTEERGQRLALESRVDALESERDERKPLVRIAWAAIAAAVTGAGAFLAAKFGGK